jgi:hypothetical protein
LRDFAYPERTLEPQAILVSQDLEDTSGAAAES